MKRGTLNYLVDGVTFAGVLAMVATGLILEFVLPPGSGGRGHRGGQELWGLGRHDWGDWHFYLAMGLGALLLIHLALHWSWICAMTLRPFGAAGASAGKSPLKRNLAGCAILAGVVGLGYGFVQFGKASVSDSLGAPALAQSARESPAAPQTPAPGKGPGAERINGSMTLAEAATALGVDVQRLRAELGLPESVDASERLGALRRRFGFEMSRVRRPGGR
jgi:hypothetical protein